MSRYRVLVVAAALACSACGDGDSADASAPVKPLDGYTLRAPVDVVEDDQGVPHLYAKSDLDAIFAQGYRQAADALFMLEVTRRSALGTLAEVLGDSALIGDKQARTFGFAHWGSESAQLLRETRPADYNLLVAFVAGINRRIEEVSSGQAAPPPELAKYGLAIEPWTPEDALAIGIRIQLGFSSTLSFDLLYTMVDKLVSDASVLPVFATYKNAFIMDQAVTSASWVTPAGSPRLRPGNIDAADARVLFDALDRLYLRHGMGEGSNSWAVSGAYTDNGRPYLVNDSHAGLTEPNRMHLTHLSGGGSGLDAIGFSFLGLPGIHVGHNRHVAWGATTNFADATDIWEVDLDGDAVKLGDKIVPLATRSELIRVRKPDGTSSEISFDVSEVPGLGVLLPSDVLPVPKALISSRQLLLGWPGFSATDELAMFFGMDRAKNLDELEAAVGIGRTGMQNWLAASADDIRLQVHGLVPDRGPIAGRPRANRLMDGSDPKNLWTGSFLPDERLPRLDGNRPFIVTANNDPWGHTADNDPLNDEFYYGSFFSPGIRARRLMDTLGLETKTGGITRDQMQQLQTSIQSTLAAEMVPLIVAAVTAVGSDPKLSTAAAKLAAWDGRMTRDSEEAALFRLTLAFVSRKTLEPSLAFLFDGVDEAQPVTIQKMSLLVFTLDIQGILKGQEKEILASSLSDALAEVEKRKAAKPSYAWGDLHRAAFKKPDDSVTELATDGDDSTINVAQSHCWDNGQLAEHCVSTAGAVYRLVYGFDADGVPRATFDVPAGNAGSTSDWVEGVYHPLLFQRAEVDAATKSSGVLDPK